MFQLKHAAFVLTGLVALGAGFYLYSKQASAPTRESNLGDTRIVRDLEVPWETRVLPDGSLMTTERPGTVRVAGREVVEFQVPGVWASGESGLLGLALDPDFKSNRYVYFYYTSKDDGSRDNRVVRYTFDGKGIGSPYVLISGIPAEDNHDGGRIAFGPDNYLYIATGDAGDEPAAQDTKKLGGKILRIERDGSTPADNPFANEVWSYGHRNVQGLAWDGSGRLWATEHGRSGVQSGYDELNLIRKGGNYGWPEVQGDGRRDGMVPPVVHSGPSATWAPAGMIFHEGALYFGGLRGQALYKATLDGERVSKFEPLLKGVYGRIRSVFRVGDELWIGTSNRDGRGSPAASDDILTPVTIP